MKFLVTGVLGQLGFDVMNELAKRGYEAYGSDIAPEFRKQEGDYAVNSMPYVQMDITDKDSVKRIINDIKPDHIIHCAAWTAVDAAEDEENKPKVMAVNVNGCENIAKAAKDIDAVMTYISTDYVFSGQGEKPWDPDCKDYAPLNVYGESKYLGEKAVSENTDMYFIVRIAWVFGLNGNNFIKTMIKVGKSHPEVRVVCDQIGTPTYTFDLARLLVDMNETNKYGYYHATNSEVEGDGEYTAEGCKTGFISWYDFTKEIYRQAGMDTKVTPVTTEEYGLSKAARPRNSRLDKSKLTKAGFTPLPTWQDALRRYLEIMG